VVVSIFVNPTQFGPNEDLARYPRDFARDKALCKSVGVDVVFAPTAREMYPAGEGRQHSTCVVEEELSRGMEGASRPTHFRGVTTVVAKLLNIVLPDIAVFGAKDFQQAAIVRRMVRDLNFPLRVVVAPTLREPDGLAMSSRNKYLEGALRQDATVLWRALQHARERVREDACITATRLRREIEKLINSVSSARLDYVEFFHPETLIPVTRVEAGTQMALAVFVGETRLIDNSRL
jgi:pantoate--beta-alanine ligase